MGSSNRGGSRVRKKNLSISSSTPAQTLPSLLPVEETSPHYGEPTSIPGHLNGPVESDHESDNEQNSGGDSPDDNTIPRNPSDAWQLLKDVAKSDKQNATAPQQTLPDGHAHPNQAQNANMRARGSGSMPHTGISSYRLVREGYLTPDVIHVLVQDYFTKYHCYLPLVPRRYMHPEQLDEFAVNDKHLLTAVLTIASKDLVNQPHIHESISRYMHDLISGIAAGYDCEVEAVEALLLLAEWEPHGLRHNVETVGRGEEDRSAWMHVGMALRTGYYLSLDRTSFRQETEEEAKVDARKRFAWANCYVSDRLISVRIGRAFWSRGPGPMTGLSERDFPTLQPEYDGDEDYAKIFQATLSLTQLYSNVHDVLYSGMRSSGQMMLMGEYVKYVDDFRTAIERWHQSWGPLPCSPHIKITLQMSYEYLRLYTNAFVFQAQISQAIARKKKETPLREHLRKVFSNIGSLPDARFIWGSVAAAKSLLTLLSTQIDPVKHLRHMPLRFYLYAIYSAVFLYKARSFGVMEQHEEQTVRDLVYRAMDTLNLASLSPQHAGSRYARLLELLWVKSAKSTQPRHNIRSPAAQSDSQLSSTGSIKLDAGGHMQYSPANDFSWLDLEAVGDFVLADPMAVSSSANILAPMGGYQPPTAFLNNADAMSWSPQGGLMNPFQTDVFQGNLPF